MQKTLCAFLKEPDYFFNLNGLQVLFHATSSDKDPIENKKRKKIESGGQGENDDLLLEVVFVTSAGAVGMEGMRLRTQVEANWDEGGW